MGPFGHDAQFGVKPGRTPYKYKNPKKGRVEKVGRQGWDNIQILVNGLSREGRNPIFFTKQEKLELNKIWQRAANRAFRGRRPGPALAMGAALVSRKMLKIYRSHMADMLTRPGKPATPLKEHYRKSSLMRARGRVQTITSNYRRGGAEFERARFSGYGVDTGQLWDSMQIDTRKVRS